MKVVIICSRLCYGGAERVAVMWANGFADRGYDVILASNYNEPITYKVDQQVRLLNIFPSTQNKLKKWWGALSSLRKHIKEEKTDVLIGVMSTCSMMAKLASLGYPCRVIATEHNSFERPSSAPFSKHDWFMKFVTNRLYDAITVLTDADRLIIAKKFKLVITLPNPLSIQPTGKVLEKMEVVLAAGRLDDWHYKGFDLLIKAWGQINRQLPIDNGQWTIDNGQNDAHSSKLTGWRLQIAGTGSEESLEYLKQLCKENGVEDSVDFLGFRTDIEELYKQSEIFVLSSRYEGFGLVLLEAMSQGCACVACDYKGRQREIICPDGDAKVSSSSHSEAAKPSTAVSSLKEFQDSSVKCQDSKELKPDTTPLHGVEVCGNGILCEVDDVEALAEGIKRMMEDEDYRKNVQKKAIERSKYYSIDIIMDRWETLLAQIVN